MQLKPSGPPRRSGYKLLQQIAEIRRLRSEGHTLKAIRQTLKDAGISVGLATVWRAAEGPLPEWYQPRGLQQATGTTDSSDEASSGDNARASVDLQLDTESPTNPSMPAPSPAATSPSHGQPGDPGRPR